MGLPAVSTSVQALRLLQHLQLEAAEEWSGKNDVSQEFTQHFQESKLFCISRIGPSTQDPLGGAGHPRALRPPWPGVVNASGRGASGASAAAT